MKRYCVLILSLIIFSCKNSNQPKWDFTKEIDRTSVIITNEKNDPYIAVLQDKYNKKRFTLTAKQIQQIDSVLKIKIEDINPELEKQFDYEENKKWNSDQNLTRKDYGINLSKYKRQYILYEDKSQNLNVRINGLCTTHGNDYWLSKEVGVDGGGSCYFTLNVNLKTGESGKIEINAPL